MKRSLTTDLSGSTSKRLRKEFEFSEGQLLGDGSREIHPGITGQGHSEVFPELLAAYAPEPNDTPIDGLYPQAVSTRTIEKPLGEKATRALTDQKLISCRIQLLDLCEQLAGRNTAGAEFSVSEQPEGASYLEYYTTIKSYIDQLPDGSDKLWHHEINRIRNESRNTSSGHEEFDKKFSDEVVHAFIKALEKDFRNVSILKQVQGELKQQAQVVFRDISILDVFMPLNEVKILVEFCWHVVSRGGKLKETPDANRTKASSQGGRLLRALFGHQNGASEEVKTVLTIFSRRWFMVAWLNLQEKAYHRYLPLFKNDRLLTILVNESKKCSARFKSQNVGVNPVMSYLYAVEMGVKSMQARISSCEQELKLSHYEGTYGAGDQKYDAYFENALIQDLDFGF